MTYLLVCALCAAMPQQMAARSADAGDPALAPDLRIDASSLELDRAAAALAGARAAPLAFTDQSASDGHAGHDDGARVGPMWIMMGVMMVGMMVVLGAYMMRGHVAAPLQPGALASPHLAAIPPAAGFRPGG
ncbi:MAG TPA: hypothetical protein VIV57_21445 [Anaeromyxobacter sp.]